MTQTNHSFYGLGIPPIGRTGRAGHEGRAISFATSDQRGDVRNIERLMRRTLPLGKHPQ